VFGSAVATLTAGAGSANFRLAYISGSTVAGPARLSGNCALVWPLSLAAGTYVFRIQIKMPAGATFSTRFVSFPDAEYANIYAQVTLT
jgi:hypothetical protein